MKRLTAAITIVLLVFSMAICTPAYAGNGRNWSALMTLPSENAIAACNSPVAMVLLGVLLLVLLTGGIGMVLNSAFGIIWAAGSEEGRPLPSIIARIDAELAEAGLTGAPETLIGIGGTVTTMGAVKQKMTRYDAAAIRGSVLTKEDIDAQIRLYAARTVEQRREIPGLPPKRADIILAGALILRVIADRLHADGLTVSDRGLRHGLAYELFLK